MLERLAGTIQGLSNEALAEGIPNHTDRHLL